MLNILMILILTSICCSILGVFIVLRKASMLTDAISHTVLLGIVLAYFVVGNLDSPLLIIGASLMALITVILIESLGNTKLVSSSDAIGVVYPILLSISVILISKFFKSTHLDTDIVLMGNIIISSLPTINIFGLEVSVSLAYAVGLLSILLLYILVFNKELKISIFDEEYAKLIGVPVGFIFYSLMSLTSITAVISFNILGSMLVISYFVAPASIALLFTKKLNMTVFLTVIVSSISCIIGYFIAINLNVSISGVCATINMLLYIFAIIYSRVRGKL